MNTEDRFASEIASIHAELQRLKASVARIQSKIKKLESDESAIRQTADRLGIELSSPDAQAIAEATAKKRSGMRVRAIDAALQVVKPGESVSNKEVADRVASANIPFESSRPEHALTIAMRRSPQFVFIGQGMFRRKLQEVGGVDDNATDSGDTLFTGSGGNR